MSQFHSCLSQLYFYNNSKTLSISQRLYITPVAPCNFSSLTIFETEVVSYKYLPSLIPYLLLMH